MPVLSSTTVVDAPGDLQGVRFFDEDAQLGAAAAGHEDRRGRGQAQTQGHATTSTATVAASPVSHCAGGQCPRRARSRPQRPARSARTRTPPGRPGAALRSSTPGRGAPVRPLAPVAVLPAGCITRAVSEPCPLIVPARILSPEDLSTGIDSPVSQDSSRLDLPEMTSASSGTFSPGRTTASRRLATSAGGTVDDSAVALDVGHRRAPGRAACEWPATPGPWPALPGTCPG